MEFVDEYDALAGAVAARRAADPQWEPAKPRTPVVDPYPPPAPSAKLDAWLDRQSAAFAAWAAGHPEGEPWDFSPRSLDALAAVLLSTLTPDDVADIDACSQPRCSFVVQPPRERPRPWSAGSTPGRPAGWFGL